VFNEFAITSWASSTGLVAILEDPYGRALLDRHRRTTHLTSIYAEPVTPALNAAPQRHVVGSEDIYFEGARQEPEANLTAFHPCSRFHRLMAQSDRLSSTMTSNPSAEGPSSRPASEPTRPNSETEMITHEIPDLRDVHIPTGRSNTYRRPEQPPRNASNKMICKFPDCSNLTFERKCEWG